ncbi:hypothetical protein ACFPM0_19850 [Pseudonocardia sulfidoxydans]|uniref:hypothetical protein n=1 Tax=Pseudonocardia sulfidoxydans TaxID=54011 RepID=UPI00360F73F1
MSSVVSVTGGRRGGPSWCDRARANSLGAAFRWRPRPPDHPGRYDPFLCEPARGLIDACGCRATGWR